MPAGQGSGIRHSLGSNVHRKTFLQVPMREFWPNSGVPSSATLYVLIFKIAFERLKWRNYVCSYISST